MDVLTSLWDIELLFQLLCLYRLCSSVLYVWVCCQEILITGPRAAWQRLTWVIITSLIRRISSNSHQLFLSTFIKPLLSGFLQISDAYVLYFILGIWNSVWHLFRFCLLGRNTGTWREKVRMGSWQGLNLHHSHEHHGSSTRKTLSWVWY